MNYNKINVRKIFLIVFLFLISTPFLVNAQGLVPCGGPDQPACQLCHLFVLFDNIVRFLLIPCDLNSYVAIVPLIAILMVVIGGVMFFAAVGDPTKINQAKSLLTWVVIGLVIIYGAWLLINLFFSLIGVEEWTGLKEGWFKIDCPITTESNVAEAILVTKSIVITDESVTTEVNSVPSSQTIIGDYVYSVVSQEDTKAPATITLSYTDEWVTNAGLDENTLAIYRYDETLYRWVGLESTVDTVNNTVTAVTDHLSIFAIMGRKASVTDCECTSGDCCDGCHFYNSDEMCDYDEDEEEGCPEGTGCGSAEGTRKRFKYRHCSGSTSECTGAWGDWEDWGEWSKTNCSSEEICANGTCEYSVDCGCECTSGRCCDGCHYDPDDTICDLGELGGCDSCGYSSDCTNEGIGVIVKELLRCHSGLCSLSDLELKSCTCLRNTDGKICGEGKICEDGVCVTAACLIPLGPWDIDDPYNPCNLPGPI